MIETSEAIRSARGLIGTAYSELDCINLIKKVIRTSAGGDKRYTTAGTNELWNSFDSAPKYRHLIWRQSGDFRREGGHAGVHGRWHGRRESHRAGDGAGHGHPLKQEPGRRGRNRADGKAGWNGLGVHRMIGVDYSEGGKAEVSESEKILATRR